MKKILTLGSIVILIIILLFILKNYNLFNLKKNNIEDKVTSDNKISIEKKDLSSIDVKNTENKNKLVEVEKTSKSNSSKGESIVGLEEKAVKFKGKFEKFYTGCYSDGECYAVVDGKKITTTIGWSREAVGKFENTEIKKGTEVEVYASLKKDGTYSLYGSEKYYIKEVK